MDTTELAKKIVAAQSGNHRAQLYDLVSEAPSVVWPKSLTHEGIELFQEHAQRYEDRYESALSGSVGWVLYVMLTQDGAAEEMGMHPDDRVTCHSCRSWADHAH